MCKEKCVYPLKNEKSVCVLKKKMCWWYHHLECVESTHVVELREKITIRVTLIESAKKSTIKSNKIKRLN